VAGVNCVRRKKESTEKEHDAGKYFHGESLGKYWCEKCGFEEK
jgi:hypothetical protein